MGTKTLFQLGEVTEGLGVKARGEGVLRRPSVDMECSGQFCGEELILNHYVPLRTGCQLERHTFLQMQPEAGSQPVCHSSREAKLLNKPGNLKKRPKG